MFLDDQQLQMYAGLITIAALGLTIFIVMFNKLWDKAMKKFQEMRKYLAMYEAIDPTANELIKALDEAIATINTAFEDKVVTTLEFKAMVDAAYHVYKDARAYIDSKKIIG